MALTDAALLGGLGAFAAFTGLAFVFVAIFYVYFALTLMTIAKRMGVENAWLAWIPIANIYLMTQMAGINGLWTLIVLAPLIPFIGSLAFVGIMIWWWWVICEKVNRPGWWSLLIMLVPVVNLVMLGVLAWGNKS